MAGFGENDKPVQGDAPAGPYGANDQQPSGFLRRAVADPALALAKGAVGVPEAAVGVADIFTGGQAGKEAQALGFRPKEAKQFLETYQSPELQQARANVGAARGFGGTLAALAENPSVIADTAVESLPSMGAGGVAGRGFLAARGIAPAAATARQAAAAGALGEGVVSAGQTAEQVRQESPTGELTAQQAALAAGSGGLTGAIGFGAGRVANRLGIGDLETALVRGKAGAVADEAGKAAAKAAPKGVTRRVGEGVLTEGVFEELPQSMQEQIAQNLALGKPWNEGVPEAGATGMVVGGLTGGVVGAMRGPAAAPEPEAAPAAPLQLGFQPDPIIVFPDGTAGRRSEVDAYVASLPADQQAAARAKLAGLAPQAADATSLGAAPSSTTSATAATIDAPDFSTSPGAGALRDGLPFTQEVDTSGLSLVDPQELARQRAATVDFQPQDLTPDLTTSPGAGRGFAGGLEFQREPIQTGGLSLAPDGPNQSGSLTGTDPASLMGNPMGARADLPLPKGPIERVAALAPQKTPTAAADVQAGSPQSSTGPAAPSGPIARVATAGEITGATQANEAAAEQSTGQPFPSRFAAERARRTSGVAGEVVRANGEWIIKTEQQTDVQAAQAEQAGREADAAMGGAAAAQPAVPGAGTAAAAQAAGVTANAGQPAPTAAATDAGAAAAAAPAGSQPARGGAALASDGAAASEQPSGVAGVAKPLSVGRTPQDAQTVTVRDGVVHIGREPALNYDTAEPVTVPAGATDAQVRKALSDAGTLSSRQRFFGGQADTAPQPTPQQEQPQQQAQARARGAPSSPLRAFLRDVGVKPEIAKDLTGENGLFRAHSRLPKTFRKDGLNIDALVERAIERGFLLPEDRDDTVMAGRKLMEMVQAELRGQIQQPQFDGSLEERLAAQMRERMADEEQAARDFVLSPEELDETGYTDADAALQARVRELIEQANAAGVDAESVLEEVAKRDENATQDEYHAAAAQALEAAIPREGGQGAQDRSGDPGQAGAEPGAAAQGLTPAPDLLGDTPNASQQAAAAERAQRQERDRRQQQTAPDAGEFRLAGSDRADDVGAAAGQQDLLPAAAPSAQAAPTKIEDFGEKLEGARKDYAALLKDAMALDVAAVPLSKSWPEPDYTKLLAGGADPRTVAMVHSMRDAVPTKPQSGWKVRAWTEKVTQLRRFANELLADNSTASRAMTLLESKEFATALREIRDRAELYQRLGHERSLRGISISSGSYSVFEGVRYDPPRTIWTVEREAKASSFSNWPRQLAKGDTREEAIAAFEKSMREKPAEVEKKLPTFDLWRDSGKVHVGKKIGREYVSLKSFADVKEARTWRDTHLDELAALLERYKSTPFERRPDNAPRVGADHRGGARVTPEAFAEAFGFRGVQFGNYVEQSKRQDDLNRAYDSLMDLAAIIGVPPRALSLNGELGLAFGARGRGGKNAPAAHYEPGRVVINLTKESGAGALAHEWFHAVDGYFARLDGGAGGHVTAAVRNPGLRPALQAAIDQLNTTLRVTGMYRRARELDKRRTSAYWALPHEVAARAFESYVVAKLQDQNASNDYLANIVDPAYWKAQEALTGREEANTFPYVTESEMGKVREAFDTFFRTVETRDSARGIAMFSKRADKPVALPPVVIGSKLGAATKHPDYATAKAGDSGAALRLAQAMVTDKMVDEVRALIGSARPVIAPVVAHEAGGRNKIPRAVAEVLAKRLGLQTADGIVQANRPKRTQLDGLDRIFAQPEFEGPVQTGQQYLLVDDTLTQGATFAALASHIQQSGAEVTGAIALTGKGYSARIELSPETLRSLREKHGDLEAQFRAATGYSFDGLTQSEARYLLNFEPAEQLRARIAEEGRRRGEGGDAQAPGLKPGFRRGDSASGLGRARIHSAVQRMTARWERKPIVRVIDTMFEAPAAVRDEWLYQQEQGGSGQVQGFFNPGDQTVYIVAPTITDEAELRKVLFHEALGHYGLRGVYGKGLVPILQEIAAQRPQLVAQKAEAYGLDVTKELDRLIAAEEVLAEMAQTRPELGWVRRAVAYVRQFLRQMGVRIGLSDNDIIANYILPARGFVERGGAPLAAAGRPTMSRADNAPEDSRAVFSRGIAGDVMGRKYTPAQEAAMRRTGMLVDEVPLKERVQELRSTMWKSLYQGVVDQFAPIAELSKDAYSLLRLSKGASGAFEVFLRGGRLKLTDGVYDFDDSKRGGVVDRLLKPLQGEHHDFLRWVAANRAEQLAKEDREHLFTADDIRALKSLADGQLAFDYAMQHGPAKGQKTRNRIAAYQDSLKTFNEFHKNALDMAEQSGLIDGESRALWEKEFYVPFYRVFEEEGVRGATIKSGVVRQQAFKKLKGGQQKLNMDLLENTLMNWAHLLDAAAKNRAAKATMDVLVSTQNAKGEANAIEADEATARQMANSVGKKEGVVWIMDKGRQRYFFVDDPHLMTALSALQFAGFNSPVMKALGQFKHWLTIGVTASPFFKIRNLIRDSVQAIGTAPISPNVAGNLAQGWKLAKRDADSYFRLLAGGGTIHFGTMLEGSEAKRVQSLVEAGIDQTTVLDSEEKLKAFHRKYIAPALDAYNELGNRGEAVNRASLYDQLRRQGKSHAEASLQARDLLDFSMQGSFNTIRFLTQVVPFMNARIQGLAKLGRAAKEDPARFSALLGSVALLSIGLAAGYADDDDWKKREEWDRNNYWWFKLGGVAFRIPKPFEVGAIGTLAERSFELATSDEMTGTRFRKQMLDILGDQLSFNPLPQLVKPILDVYANKDSFSGRPIESMGMERLRADYRFTDRTSMAARAASTAINAGTQLVGVQGPSPLQIDHLVRGYFGWLGTMVVSAADTVARPATGQTAQATPDYWKTLTGGMVAGLEDAPSRYVSAMYEQAKEIEQAYSTWRQLVREGKVEEAEIFRQAHTEALARYHQLQTVKRAEQNLNAFARRVQASAMEPDEKRDQLRAIRQQQDQIARPVVR